MKLQRTTFILLLFALGLGGFVYLYETQAVPKQEAAKAQKQQIFTFKEEQVQFLTIKTQDQTWQFERVNQTAENTKAVSQWRMKSPQETPASDASVAFLLDLLTEKKSASSFFAPASQVQEYGFDRPLATVEVTLNNRATHKLIIGKPDFSGNLLYAQASPNPSPSQQIQVLLVSKDFENAVKRPLPEWQEDK